MTTSQLIIISIVLFVIYRTLLSFKAKKVTRSFFYVWTFLWLIVLFFAVEQDLLIRFANYLGVGRGVDLVIYSSIIVAYYLLYRIFIKLSEIDRKITNIVREGAIREIKFKNKK